MSGGNMLNSEGLKRGEKQHLAFTPVGKISTLYRPQESSSAQISAGPPKKQPC